MVIYVIFTTQFYLPLNLFQKQNFLSTDLKKNEFSQARRNQTYYKNILTSYNSQFLET